MKIRQIMPADGWRAALVQLDFDTSSPHPVGEELVGWALIEDNEGKTSIEGLVRLPSAGHLVVPCYLVRSETREDDVPMDFVGYLKEGEALSRYREEGDALYARWRKNEEPIRTLLEAGWILHEDRSYGRRWESPDGREMDIRKALAELRGEGGDGDAA